LLNRIIDFTLAYRWLVLIAIIVLLAAGGYALYTIPVEAFPDLTNNQVVIVTDAYCLWAREVTDKVFGLPTSTGLFWHSTAAFTTLLNLMGLSDERLTYLHAGRYRH